MTSLPTYFRRIFSRPINKDRLGAIFILGFTAFYALQTRHIQIINIHANEVFDARSLPLFLVLCGVALCLLIIVFTKQHDKPRDETSATAQNSRPLAWIRFCSIILLMIAFGLTLRPLGFIFASTLFLSIGFLLLRPAFIGPSLLLAAGISITFWLIMHFGLGIYLPALPSFYHA